MDVGSAKGKEDRSLAVAFVCVLDDKCCVRDRLARNVEPGC